MDTYKIAGCLALIGIPLIVLDAAAIPASAASKVAVAGSQWSLTGLRPSGFADRASQTFCQPGTCLSEDTYQPPDNGGPTSTQGSGTR